MHQVSLMGYGRGDPQGEVKSLEVMGEEDEVGVSRTQRRNQRGNMEME